jgi:hypothetical protein
MSIEANTDFTNGSSFFGFMGVSMALVLASIYSFIHIWEQPMELPKLEPESVVSPSGVLTSS